MYIKIIDRTDAFPIGKHLQINFQECERDEFVGKVIEYLKYKGFDAEKSRTLVFVRSRKKAEQYAADFNSSVKEWKADFFHAGISADDRQRIYKAYKDGETSILFATKAFGMGMNIPNIHFLFHLQPSSSFEDFLQEVGRAGRNKKNYEDVGFSEELPIQTICFYDKKDFGSIKDLTHKSSLTWENLVQGQQIITDYCKQFINSKLPTKEKVAVNANLFNQYPNFSDSSNFRMYLYWLEKAKKIELGYYVQSHFVFDNQSFINKTDDIINEQQRRLVEYLKEVKRTKFEEEVQSAVEFNDIKKVLKCSKTELYKLLIKAHNKKYLKWLLLKSIKITNRTEIRRQVISNRAINNMPSIVYFFKVVNEILSEKAKNGRLNLSKNEVDYLIKEIRTNYIFSIDKMPWLKDKKEINEEITKAIQEVRDKRLKHIWWFMSIIPNVKQRSIIDIDTGEVSYNITINQKVNFDWINRFKENMLTLLQHIYNQNITEGNDIFDIPTLAGLDFWQEDSIDYLGSLLVGLKKLGFIKYNGGLMPISIECLLKNDEPLDREENQTDKLFAENFERTQRLKQLRLLALQAFSKITNRATQEQYIKAYFNCKDEGDIINLLGQYPKYIDTEIIEQYKGKALEKRVNGDDNDDSVYGLNAKQLEVYNASFKKHLSVIAGPGSGKTHTLVLRIARLIHEKKIDASQILVLAFNRSVVLELKERIRELFYELGYSNLTRSLKIFTFHGLIKYCLREEVKDIKPDKWTSLFNKKLQEEKGLIKNRLGIIQYIFIDEFQDINNERLEQIEFLANLNNAIITAIGDPNQSIYGFDRVKDGALAPRPYYEQFSKKYKPNSLSLNINYRSYDGIISAAESLLNYQNTPFQVENFVLPKLKTQKGQSENCIEVYDLTKVEDNWTEKLKTLCEQGVGEVAIMCRRNEEVFKVFGEIKNLVPDNYEIRIQGGNDDIFKSREVSRFLGYIERNFKQQLPDNFVEILADQKQMLLEHKNYSNWYPFYLDILHALHYEFDNVKEDNATYQDLYDFIQEFTRKDDGQLYQLYERTKGKLGFKNIKRIILTTIHRVKGLEYETVMILPSYTALPFMPKEHIPTSDYIDEELRLLYVAYSRAEEKLIIYKSKRELAIEEKSIDFEVPQLDTLKYTIKTGVDKVILFSVAKKHIQEKFNKIPLGIEIQLHRNHNNKWEIKINGSIVGYLSKYNLANKERYELQGTNVPNSLKGFYLSGFIKYTYQEAIDYDNKIDAKKKKITDFHKKWDDFCKTRGWILIPDFAGYGEPY
jgi:superfamily I DNA/RNA helicase